MPAKTKTPKPQTEAEAEVEKVLVAIEKKMQELGESKADVARVCDIGYQQTWDLFKRKKGTPKLQTLLRLKRYLAPRADRFE